MLTRGSIAHPRPDDAVELACHHLDYPLFDAVSTEVDPILDISGACNGHNFKVSVVIMNWKRPHNVHHIVSQMVTYDEVGEIMVMMCNEGSIFNFTHPKVPHL